MFGLFKKKPIDPNTQRLIDIVDEVGFTSKEVIKSNLSEKFFIDTPLYTLEFVWLEVWGGFNSVKTTIKKGKEKGDYSSIPLSSLPNNYDLIKVLDKNKEIIDASILEGARAEEDDKYQKFTKAIEIIAGK